ncbi:MAG: C39 family peptidase [Kiritimatiellae bacterium]|nr:C39 family peptidase [Kiritimatiellia bacterium]
MHKFVCQIIVALTLSISLYAAGDISSLITSGEIFKQQYNAIQEFSMEKYSWVTKDVAIRFPTPNFTLGSQELGETILYLKDQKPNKIIISIYNRGDNGQITNEAFVGKLRASANILNSIFRVKGEVANRKSDPTRSTFDIGGMLWKTQNAHALMEYSVKNQGARTVPTAEYIRLTIIPAASTEQANKSIRNYDRKKSLIDNVISLANGGKEITGIPMVDQGQKGYCAAATTARVMGYYGYEQLDQHQIAQWAKTDSLGGTSMDKMMKGIRRVLHDTYKLNIIEIESSDIKTILKLVERYNAEAKRAKLEPIDLPKTGVIDIGQIYSSFNPNLLKKVQTKNRQKNEFLFNKIKTNIDKGIPLVWSVQLGIIPEPGLPQNRGGHMRLIIGYGGRTPNDRYIVYSDSWGEGHGRKEMSIEDALTITVDLYTISPK